jgi:hypothetical protein
LAGIEGETVKTDKTQYQEGLQWLREQLAWEAILEGMRQDQWFETRTGSGVDSDNEAVAA